MLTLLKTIKIVVVLISEIIFIFLIHFIEKFAQIFNNKIRIDIEGLD